MRQHCTMLSVSREPENGISIACNRTILQQPSKDPNKRENNLFFYLKRSGRNKSQPPPRMQCLSFIEKQLSLKLKLENFCH